MLKALMMRMMPNCKQTAELVSQSMDGSLPMHKRMGLRIHLGMCVLCRRYKEQLLLMRRILYTFGGFFESDSPEDALPPEAKARIQKTLSEKI